MKIWVKKREEGRRCDNRGASNWFNGNIRWKHMSHSTLYTTLPAPAPPLQQSSTTQSTVTTARRAIGWHGWRGTNMKINQTTVKYNLGCLTSTSVIIIIIIKIRSENYDWYSKWECSKSRFHFNFPILKNVSRKGHKCLLQWGWVQDKGGYSIIV